MTYIQPFFPALLVSTAILTILCKGTRARLWAAGCSIVLLLFSWPPAAWLALRPLEGRYSTQPPADKEVQAIVVLSSQVLPAEPPMPDPVLAGDTYKRCVYAAWLFRNWKSVPVLASGKGSGDISYAKAMKDELARQGVPVAMIWTEERSHSTYENALYSAEILRREGIHKIALVTEAYHMVRAEKCFQKQGFEVVPAPCGFREVFDGDFFDLLPSGEAVTWNEETMHEAIGLIWYSLLGRI